TGFQLNPETGAIATAQNTRTVIPLEADRPTMITQPIVNPVTASAPQAPVAPPAVEEPSILEPYLKPVEAKVEPKIEVKPEPVAVQQQVAQPAPQQQPTLEFPAPPVRMAPAQPEPLQAKVEPVKAPETSEKRVFTLYDNTTAEPVNNAPVEQRNEVNEARLSPAEHQSRVEQRVAKVRELNMRLRTPNGLSDLEREPAYKRKNIALNEGSHSTDSNVSRYTLNEETDENGERRVELRRNNPYLHDNVD
ncbi:MAG TPA: hypothetical protein PL070_01460, partial [Flavobacteriales bacterium]|nr:hypothetical protein [Flavobacteriales bacterium]